MSLDHGCLAALAQALLAAVVALADRDPAKVSNCRHAHTKKPITCRALSRISRVKLMIATPTALMIVGLCHVQTLR